MIKEQITKALYKISSDATKILIDQLKEHPEKFFSEGESSLLSIYHRRTGGWEWVLNNGTFPWYEKALLKVVIRDVKMQLTQEKILEALMNGGSVSEEEYENTPTTTVTASTASIQKYMTQVNQAMAVKPITKGQMLVSDAVQRQINAAQRHILDSAILNNSPLMRRSAKRGK